MLTLEQQLRRLIAALDSLGECRDRVEYEAVTLMRTYGLTWEQIGEAYEPPKSRQAAEKRHRRLNRRFGHP